MVFQPEWSRWGLPNEVDFDRYSEYRGLVEAGGKDVRRNLQIRRSLLRWAAIDPAHEDALWDACRRDLLFYVNAFVWILEPRESRILPFVTYPFQDRAFQVIDGLLGRRDLLAEKSRDMGLSWILDTAIDHRWRFFDNMGFLLLSRKEEFVDKAGNPDALMVKLDIIEENLPGFLRASNKRVLMHKGNLENRSTVDGESTNKYAGVGGRKFALLLDEFSKMENQRNIVTGTRDVTRCRLFNFTPNGAANMAYQMATGDDYPIQKLTLHWHMHPDKARGLYRVNGDGAVETLDTEYWTQERLREYHFVRKRPKNKRFSFRSPWYDGECARASHDREIAQELDIDYLGSGEGVFESDMLEEHARKFCRPHVKAFDFVFQPGRSEPVGIEEAERGILRFWIELDGALRIPADRWYVAGVDVATGVGSSNSCISIADGWTGEKVAELATPFMDYHTLAYVYVWLSRHVFSSEPMVAWEKNGPGHGFGKIVLSSGYQHFYYAEKDDKVFDEQTDVPGWHNRPQTYYELIMAYRRAMIEGRFVNRSLEAIDECRKIIFTSNNTVSHSGAVERDAYTDAKAMHGDRVTADALCCMMVGQVPAVKPEVTLEFAPYTIGWYREQAHKAGVRHDRWAFGAT